MKSIHVPHRAVRAPNDRPMDKQNGYKNVIPSLSLWFSKLSEYTCVRFMVNHHLATITFGFAAELRAQVIDVGILHEKSVIGLFPDKLG
jgi:hypothetical protein